MCIIVPFETSQTVPLRLHKKAIYNPVFVPDSSTEVNMQKFIYYLFVMSYYALFAYNEWNERTARPFTCGVYRISERFHVQRRTGVFLWRWLLWI
jgi:hypothetical protein